MPRVYCAGVASGEDVADLIVRTLCQNEREELLDLLDLWPQEAPWTGRTFFRRYIEEDATFEDRNYVVGEEAGRLVACVQIFPRPVRIRGHEVPMGGIGSVFTHPERRGCGHAVKLLEETARRMIERGMETSLLFGIRPMYSPLGWKPWGATARLLSRGEGADVDVDAHDFEPRRDLAEVRPIHESYSGRQEGTVVRDDRLWETSLRVAGNPEEEFLVARRAGRIVAYARAMVSEGFMAISEVGRVEDAADTLAAIPTRSHLPSAARSSFAVSSPSALRTTRGSTRRSLHSASRAGSSRIPPSSGVASTRRGSPAGSASPSRPAKRRAPIWAASSLPGSPCSGRRTGSRRTHRGARGRPSRRSRRADRRVRGGLR
jgi:GNAT superfamily N-acetyltransferase